VILVDETTYRALDAVARALGRPLSAREVVDAVRRSGKPAYYANTYSALRSAETRGTLRRMKVGRSLAFSLDLEHPGTVDDLVELEVHRKRSALAGSRDGAAFLAALERTLRGAPVDFACAGDLHRGLRLRRLPILVATRGAADVRGNVEAIASRTGITVDLLAMPWERTVPPLGRAEAHPVPELLGGATAFFQPQAFWGRMADASAGGSRLTFQTPTDPRLVPTETLSYNLARHGAPLLGAGAGGRDLCVEYTVAAALGHKEARLRAAGAALLKERRLDPSVLAFASARWGLEAAVRRAAPSEWKALFAGRASARGGKRPEGR
jgi:hypothetical protein